MRNIIIFLVLLFTKATYSQTNTIDITEGTSMGAPIGTYIKDINNIFTPYLGTWRYENGDEILLLKLEKVTKYYNAEFKTYYDFIKGNYSYSTDGGITFLVNTISTNPNNNTPDGNPIYSSDPNLNIDWENFIFKDIGFNKPCKASIRFVPNSTTQLEFKLKASKRAYIVGEESIQQGCSIPTNVILTKQ